MKKSKEPYKAGKSKAGKTAGRTGETARAETREGHGKLRAEIVCIILFASALILILSLFTNSLGFLGGFFNTLFKGCIGLGAYALPFIIALAGAIIMTGRKKSISRGKLVMAICLFLIAVSFVHTLNYGQFEEVDGATAYIKDRFLGGGVTNGGLFGALFGDMLLKILGSVGTYIILVSSAIILLIMITGKSFFDFVMRAFAKIDSEIAKRRYRNADEDGEGAGDADDADFMTEEDSGDGESASRREKSKRKVFDHVIEAEDDAEDEDEKPLHLVNDDWRKRKSKFAEGAKEPEDDTSRFRVLPGGREDAEEDAKAKGYKVLSDDDDDRAPFDDDDGGGREAEISVMGTGVEGYVPKTVTTSGEDFIEARAVRSSAPAAAPAIKVFGSPEFSEDVEEEKCDYKMPSVELLTVNTYVPSPSSKAQILENSKKLEETLKSFGVEARVVEVRTGPTVTRYEMSPGVGVKVSSISKLADDLALNLAAMGIRIEAPVPGKSVVGIEIPNKETQTVFLRDVIDDEAFWAFSSKLSFAVGKDIAGNTVIVDIAKMPHLLIAGATGSGKSVCINTIIASVLFKSTPDEVKMLMIDPKVVELNIYNGIPHLEIPVVTDPQKAAGALSWAVREMNDRYNMFAETKTRDLAGYNGILTERGEKPLPQILIIIDELADLMMTCKADVEQNICRLAQKARAAGIHLIIATQRPSVDVITGLIKANVPSRLAFAVTSGTDSRTILDMVGAEKLLGKGDMLFSPAGLSKPQRIQGAYISDKEVERLVSFIKTENGEMEYDPDKVEKITATLGNAEESGEDSDEFTEKAIEFVVARGKASVSLLQREFRIGYNRAARMMEVLEARGVVGPEDGAKPRRVMMTGAQWREYAAKRRS